MDFKERIYKHGIKERWNIKTLADSMVLKSTKGEMTISWRGIFPKDFTVVTSLHHPKMGSTTLKRKEISIDNVLKLVSDPRAHINKGGSYQHDRWSASLDKSSKIKSRRIIKMEDLQQKRDKKRIKVTGRMALYREIWRERPHKSEISGEPLIENMQHPLWRNQFLHILPHGKFKNFEFRKDNVILGTHQEHTRQTTDPGSCKADPKWDGFWARYAALFDEYERDMKANKFKFKS